MEETLFIVRLIKGEKVGDYIDVPEGYTPEEYAEALQHLDEVVGVYHGATNVGPIDPYWER